MTQPPTSIVLLHGFASTFDHNWRQTGWVDILADFGCEVPEIDLPGHGSSLRETDPAGYADVEAQVYGALPTPGPLSAAGFSAGADLLLRVAIAHPGSFERIALLGLGDTVFEVGDTSALVNTLASQPSMRTRPSTIARTRSESPTATVSASRLIDGFRRALARTGNADRDP